MSWICHGLLLCVQWLMMQRTGWLQVHDGTGSKLISLRLTLICSQSESLHHGRQAGLAT